MSLINEALKRAEAQKQDNTAPPTDQSVMRAVQTGGSSRRSSKALLVSGLLLVALVAGAWVLIDGGRSGPPSVASAGLSPTSAISQQDKQMAPRAKSGRNQQGTLDEAEPSKSDLIIARSMAESKYYRPPERKDPPRHSRPDEFPTKTDPVALAKVHLPSPVGTSPTPPVKAAVRPPAQAPQAPVTPINENDFRLSAVMRGPDGATAIINGRFATVGSVINGAKLVKINRHTAELEINGQRFTIQM